jgi:hypothetical protein
MKKEIIGNSGDKTILNVTINGISKSLEGLNWVEELGDLLKGQSYTEITLLIFRKENRVTNFILTNRSK